ncbi:MAG: sulfatase-like hydrolase/transferase [Luteitalea sp.]|nr:sulfatase-like hydrolase/transferase [Luteitalea sp.]
MNGHTGNRFLHHLTRVSMCLLLLAAGPLVPPERRSASPQAAVRPNIVFILSDDQGWNDIGYNGSRIATPNLDRLAAEGVRLKQHYVSPTCSPTRVALLTGRNPARFNVFTPLGATTDVTPQDVHLPIALQALGYSTHISGKWHIGETPEHRPLRYGFTTSYGYLRGQIDPYTHRYKVGNHVTWHRNDEFVEEDGHVTRLITDEAIRIIESAEDQPFFLYIAHHAPHYPLNEAPVWIEPYDDVFDDVWRRHYAASITHMDHEIGRVVDALDRTQRRRNTLLVFSSDNGGQESWGAPPTEYNGRYASHATLGDNTPLRGWKGQLYEGGIRVPAFVNWPAVLDGGREVDLPVHILDWAPTLIGLAGGEVDPEWNLEGRDLWTLLSGRRTDWEPRRFYWNHADRIWAVRDGDWKLVAQASGDPELFNLSSDPDEKENLAQRHPERVRELRQRLEEEQARDGEALRKP